MNLIEFSISGAIINFFEIIMCHKICNKKVEYGKYNIYLACFLQTFLLVLNYIYVDNSFKVVFTFLIMILTCKFLFKDINLMQCTLISFVVEIFLIFSEFVFMFTISIVSSVNNYSLMDSVEGKFITNILVALIFLVLCFFQLPKRIYNFLLKRINSISKSLLIVLLGFLILLINIVFYVSYYNKNNYITLVANLLIMIVYIIITINLVIKESKYKNVKKRYLKSNDELNEYERLINEYRIINHENKNQLNSIKGMTTNKKVQEYIDNILNNKNTSNTNILNQALLIPTGGLRGLIYSKLVLMTEYKINYKIHIDTRFNSKLLKNVSTKTMNYICQIIGVYLDNAIEAVRNLKIRNILINIYVDDNINIIIKNNVNCVVDVNKIDKMRFSTKGNNRGYGLVLANRIISKNDNLTNICESNNNSFEQHLIIKIKK